MANYYPVSPSPVQPGSPSFKPWSPGPAFEPGVPANDNSLLPANDNVPFKRRVKLPPIRYAGRFLRAAGWLGVAAQIATRWLEPFVHPSGGGGWVKLWEVTPARDSVGIVFTHGTGAWWGFPNKPPAFPDGPVWSYLDMQAVSRVGPPRPWYIWHRMTQSLYGTGVRCEYVAEYTRMAQRPQYNSPNVAIEPSFGPVAIPTPWVEPFPWGAPLPDANAWQAPYYPPELMPNADEAGAPREGRQASSPTGARPPSVGVFPPMVWTAPVASAPGQKPSGVPTRGSVGKPETNPTRWPKRMRPRKKTKERKVRIKLNGQWVGKLLGNYTEFVDLENALWNALPEQYRSSIPWDWYGRKGTAPYPVRWSWDPKARKWAANVNVGWLEPRPYEMPWNPIKRWEYDIKRKRFFQVSSVEPPKPGYKAKDPGLRQIVPEGLNAKISWLKFQDLYRNWDKVDLEKALNNVIRNEVGDRVTAGLNQRTRKAWRKNNPLARQSPFSPGFGPTL